MSSSKKELFEDFRKREVVKLSVKNGLHRRISAGHGIANDDEICCGDVFSAETLRNRDVPFLEKSGHRRIDVVVLTRDNIATLAHRGRNRPHRGAADAQKVDVPEKMIHKITERPQSLSRNCSNYEERNAARRAGYSPFRGCSFVASPISTPKSSRVTCVSFSTVS